MLDRCPARDYETLPARSEAMIHLAMTELMARRLTGEDAISWRDPTSPDQLRIPGRNNGGNDLSQARVDDRNPAASSALRGKEDNP
jgi:hypothetical protein